MSLRCCFVLLCLLLTKGFVAGKNPRMPFTHDTEDAGGDGFCISRDGKRLAMNYWAVWDIPSRKRLFGGKLRGAHGMSFSPDGKFLAVSGNYSEFYVYDASTGKVYWDLTLKGHGDTVLHHVEFTPDSRYLVSSSANGLLRVWDVKEKKAHALFCFPSPVRFVKESQESYLREKKDEAKGRLPDGVKTFVVSKHHVERLDNFSLSPDGKLVAIPTRRSEVLLVELVTGKVVKTLKTKQRDTGSLCFMRDGKMLAIGGVGKGFELDAGDCTIEIWDVAKGKRLRTCNGHRYTILHLAISSDGTLLASGGLFDGVRVWDVQSGKQKYALHQKEFDPDNPISTGSCSRGVAFLPDGKALLTMTYEVGAPIHFWEPATGKRIPQPPPEKEKDGK